MYLFLRVTYSICNKIIWNTVFGPRVQKLLAVALHLLMTRASDVWCLLVPGHSPTLLSSTWRFSAMDSITLIFWLLQSRGKSGCVVVVVVVVVVTVLVLVVGGLWFSKIYISLRVTLVKTNIDNGCLLKHKGSIILFNEIRNQQQAAPIGYALFCMFSFVEMIETNRISPVSPLTVHKTSAP